MISYYTELSNSCLVGHRSAENRMEEGSPVITGATGQVGRATIDALVRRGLRPTALIRGTAQLKGCVTISDWLLSDRAVAAIERAPTVVHLAGTLNPLTVITSGRISFRPRGLPAR